MSSALKIPATPLHANDNVPKPKRPRFQITRFDDVNQSVAKEYVVQGLLGSGEFSLFVAKPGTAKSVLVGDIGLHIAAGRDWHGRKVKKGLVVFFAAERKSLTERRIAAWGKKHSVSGIPFVVVSGKLDLTTGLFDAKELAKTIADLSAEFACPCRLVILDTVTRTFGPGDQHQSRDMQRYIQPVDEVTRLRKLPKPFHPTAADVRQVRFLSACRRTNFVLKIARFLCDYSGGLLGFW
jgi:RecA-family ATPase